MVPAERPVAHNVVMDQGRIAEFASPAELLRDHKSMFYAVNLTLT